MTESQTVKTIHHHWMDLGRLLACLMVIFIHSPHGELERVLPLLSTVFCHVAVPIFVMISGANFLNKEKELSIKECWIKYILPLGGTTLIYSFLYAIMTSWQYHHRINLPFLKTLIVNTINGHYHLWYIWMIIGIYAIMPFLKMLINQSNPVQLWYLIVLCFLYISIRYITQYRYFVVFRPLVIDLRMMFVLGFTVYMLLGYALLTNISKGMQICIICGGLFGMICQLFIVILNIQCDLPEGDRFGYFSPFLILISGMVFCLLMQLEPWIPEYVYPHLRLLGKLTLPCYLMHDFIIRFFNQLLYNGRTPGLILGIFTSVITFITCLLISWILSIHPFTAKWLCDWRKAKAN